jgi:hypothetical protein
VSNDLADAVVQADPKRFREVTSSDCVKRIDDLPDADAKRVEIAAGVDRAVHTSSLLWRHVGKRTGNELG